MTRERFKGKRGHIKCPKAARLVVRNLPFAISENDIRDHFSEFGVLVEVNMVKRNSVFTGCAFIQFERKLCAAKALAKTSGKDFKGRPIIVDWAVPKNTYEKTQKEGEKDESNISNDVKVKEEVLSSDEEVEQEAKRFQGYGQMDDSLSKLDNDDIKQDVTNVKDEKDADQLGVNKKIHTELFAEIKRKHQEEDMLNKRTLFVKNLPFLATNDDLRKAAETAGPVSYALVVIDPMTEHSRGTGFIRYKKEVSAKRVLDGDVTLSVNGIELIVARAQTKEEVSNKPQNDKKLPKDNRNLYLAKEGVILAGSKAAEGVSEGDMTRRLKLEQWKTTVLRNLHMFISPMRLVVHNIPTHFTDKQLFSLFKSHSPKNSIITEARIMKTVNDAEIGKSKGYGFVSFKRHDDALTALRSVNNNPDIFSVQRRPIVAFSVENKRAHNIKEKRKEMSQKNLKDSKSPNTEDSITTTSKAIKRKTPDGNKFNQVSNKKFKSAINNFSGMVAKVGENKLRSKRQLINQALKHRQALKKAKKQNKMSRSQKRIKRKKNINF